MAYVGKYIDKAPYRVYCLIGDGESAEGSIWEALHFASIKNLDNLVAIFDVNRLGQSEATSLGHELAVYEARVKAFGFETIVVDGHDVNALLAAFKKLSAVKGKPGAIIAQTYKGKGFVGIEDKDNWHGKPLGDKSADVLKELAALTSGQTVSPVVQPPTTNVPKVDLSVKLSSPPAYKLGDKHATRQVYGAALVKLGQCNERVIAMDGDTKNSTFSETYKKAFPDRYIECFIAEQNLVGVAIGAGCRGRTIPFVSTFASFFTRTFDQIRMGAISQANIKCVGSHCGVSIGEDGPSQMALEDIAMFRTIPGATVFYPSDAVSMERATELAAQNHGIAFIRTSRPATPVVYPNDTVFAVGKAHVLRSSANDKALLIGAGITLVEAITAADSLKAQGINVRVLDPFTIKPLDVEAVAKNALESGKLVIVVEDHYPEGGIGEAVASALASKNLTGVVKLVHLAVREIPRSGPPAALIEKYGISAKSVVSAVQANIA